MNRRLTLLALALALVLHSAANASAASVTFNLDCVWSGNSNSSTCGSSGPFGTVTLTDSTTNTNWIDIVVTLTNGGELERLYLNYDSTGPTSQSGWSWDGSEIDGVNLDSNDVGPGNYNYLDIDINPNDGDSSWSSTLYFRKNSGSPIQYQNIDVSMFNLLSPGNGTSGSGSNTPVWAAADIKDWCSRYKANGSCDDEDDVNAGSLTRVAPPVDPPTPVPEPSTLVLLGAGLLGAARKLRSRSAGRVS